MLLRYVRLVFFYYYQVPPGEQVAGVVDSSTFHFPVF